MHIHQLPKLSSTVFQKVFPHFKNFVHTDSSVDNGCPQRYLCGQWLSSLLKLRKVLYGIVCNSEQKPQGMCTVISTFRGVRTRLEFKVPTRLRLELNNEF